MFLYMDNHKDTVTSIQIYTLALKYTHTETEDFIVSPMTVIYLCALPDRTIQGQWPKVQIIEGIKGGEIPAKALLGFAGHWSTYCNVAQMSLAGHGPKHGLWHLCLIIAETGQQCPVLYKGDKCVNEAAHPPEGGTAEDMCLSASSLPLQSVFWRVESLRRFP